MSPKSIIDFFLMSENTSRLDCPTSTDLIASRYLTLGFFDAKFIRVVDGGKTRLCKLLDDSAVVPPGLDSTTFTSLPRFKSPLNDRMGMASDISFCVIARLLSLLLMDGNFSVLSMAMMPRSNNLLSMSLIGGKSTLSSDNIVFLT